MKKKYHIAAGLLALSILSVAGCSNSQNVGESTSQNTNKSSSSVESEIDGFSVTSQEDFTKEAEGKADGTKTIMIYMMGSDLEAGTKAATNDIQEMLDHKPDLSKVNVVVYTGGSKAWHNGIPDDVNMVYELIEEGFSPAKEYESVSMGEADTLSTFLNYSYENYKADSYNLILWDHGNGPVEGYGKDTKYDNDQLSLNELETALQSSPFKEDNKLSFIGFDACLMSSLELACVLDDYADYLIASQEVEPSYGWNYAFMADIGSKNTEGSIQSVIDHYLDYSKIYFEENENANSEVTLAAIDLTKAAAVETELNDIFKKFGENIGSNYFTLAYDRVQTRSFGRASTGSEYDLIDLGALMNEMKEDYPKQCAKVEAALDGLVVYNGYNAEKCSGVSLYYPFYNKNYYESSWGETYKELNVLDDYANYLTKYSSIWLNTNMNAYFEDGLDAEQLSDDTYSLTLTEEQAQSYAQGGYYILKREKSNGDRYLMKYVSSNVQYEDGKLSATFDGNVLHAVNGYGEMATPYMREWGTSGGVTQYSINATLTDQYYRPNSSKKAEEIQMEYSAILVSLNQESGEAEITDVLQRPEDETELLSGKQTRLSLDDYKYLWFTHGGERRLTRDDSGRILDFDDWEKSGWIEMDGMSLAKGLTFSYEPLYDNGEDYYLMFYVTNLQGDTFCSEPLPLPMENAPKGEEKEATNISWEEGSSVTLYEKDNITIEMFVSQSRNESPTWVARVDNQNDFAIDVSMSSVILNGEISDGGRVSFGSQEIPANTSNYVPIYELGKLCSEAGIEVPNQLALSMSIVNIAEEAYLLYDQPYEIQIEDTVRPEWHNAPIAGAIIKEQEIYQDEELEIILPALGIPIESLAVDNVFTFDQKSAALDYLMYFSEPIKIQIKNKAEEDATILFHGITVNGTFYTGDNGYSTNPYANITVPPDKIGYLKTDSFVPSDFTEICEELITNDEQIEEMILHLKIGEDIVDCPVKLEKEES